jgi:uncharacterized membrane protein YfcA
VEFWIVYWFMLPVCVAVASAAMFSGISGAAMLMPVFLIGFPLLGVPPLTTVAAVGMSLFLETSGFGTGVYRYLRRGLVDTQTARRLALVTVPAAVAGSILARWVPAGALRLGYGVAMVALAVLLFREPTARHGAHLTEDEEPGEDVDLGVDGDGRDILTTDGSRYRYRAGKLRGQLALSGGGAVMAGLISTGVGEATLPGLVRRSGFPLPVAAATSTVVVAATVTGAAVTHLVELGREGGLAAIPWNLLVWAVPGAIIGALVGTHLQGRIPERASQLFFASLFGLIGVTFVTVFGLGAGVDALG